MLNREQKTLNSSRIMREPQEVHTNENRALPGKKQRRMARTPSQTIALEKFYYEKEKYPTNATRSELAASVGLSKEQVSRWFSQTRLKEMRSGRLFVRRRQTRGSALRRNSCGSTKQVDNKHSDPKDVESRKFTSEGLLPIQVRFDHGSQHNNIVMDEKDTSLGSSLPLKDSFHPQIISKYPTHNELKRSDPSGYMKVKDDEKKDDMVEGLKKADGKEKIQNKDHEGTTMEKKVIKANDEEPAEETTAEENIIPDLIPEQSVDPKGKKIVVEDVDDTVRRDGLWMVGNYKNAEGVKALKDVTKKGVSDDEYREIEMMDDNEETRERTKKLLAFIRCGGDVEMMKELEQHTGMDRDPNLMEFLAEFRSIHQLVKDAHFMFNDRMKVAKCCNKHEEHTRSRGKVDVLTLGR